MNKKVLRLVGWIGIGVISTAASYFSGRFVGGKVGDCIIDLMYEKN